MSKPSPSRATRRAPLAVGVVAVLVLGATGALFSLQACGDSTGPKAPNPTGSSSTTPTPTTPTTPPPPPTNSPPPPT